MDRLWFSRCASSSFLHIPIFRLAHFLFSLASWKFISQQRLPADLPQCTSSPKSPQYILSHKKTRTKCYWSVFLQPICYNHFPLYCITESTVHHLQEQRHFVSTIFNRFLVLLSFQLLFCNSPSIFSHHSIWFDWIFYPCGQNQMRQWTVELG